MSMFKLTMLLFGVSGFLFYEFFTNRITKNILETLKRDTYFGQLCLARWIRDKENT